MRCPKPIAWLDARSMTGSPQTGLFTGRVFRLGLFWLGGAEDHEGIARGALPRLAPHQHAASQVIGTATVKPSARRMRISVCAMMASRSRRSCSRCDLEALDCRPQPGKRGVAADVALVRGKLGLVADEEPQRLARLRQVLQAIATGDLGAPAKWS